MVFRGRRHNLRLCALLFLILTPIFQGAVEMVCPQIGYLNLTANLTCIGTGRTHSYSGPTGGVLTTCDMNTSECFPEATVTIPNSSHSVLTLPVLDPVYAGYWTCSVGDYVSYCLLTVARLLSCTILSKQSTQETTLRVHHYYCSDSNELHFKTGNLTRLLMNTTRTIATVDIWETTDNVQTSFEETMLIYVCGHTSWDIACTVLEDKATSNRTSTAVIIGSVVAGIVIVTIIITLVVFLMKMNRSKQTQQPDKHVYDSTDDVARETNDTSGHEYNALYLTALARDTSYYNVISN